MARNWIVVLSLVAGLLFGASSLLAQEPAAPAPAKQVDARTLVPRDVVLYVEVNDLAGTWEAIKTGPLYGEVLETEGGKDLQILAAAVETAFQVHVGATLEEIVVGLLGRRVILAAWPNGDGADGVLLTEVRDPAFAQEMLAAFRQTDVDEGKASRFDEEPYRGHTIYIKVPPAPQPEAENEEAPALPKPGKLEYWVLCGNVAMASDSVAAVKLLIDRFEEKPVQSVLDNEKVQAALASLPTGYRAAAFVDFEQALAEKPLDEDKLASGKPPVARFLTKHLLSVVKSLRRAGIGLYVTSSGVEVRATVTRDPALLTQEMRNIFAQENVTPRALSYFSSDGVLLLSLPTVSAQMKLLDEALEIALPALSPPAGGTAEVQPVRPLDLILGRNFTREVVPGIGPEISLLVEVSPADVPVGEDAEAVEYAAAQLTATLLVGLSEDIQPEVERLVNTALGLLMAVAQEGCSLSQIQIGEVTGYVVQPKRAEPPSLNQLIQPTIAFVDGFLMVSTHPRALERALATKASQQLGNEARGLTAKETGNLSGHIVVLADLERVVQALSAAPAQGTPEDLAKVIEFVRPFAGQLTLTVRHTPPETKADLTLHTATPLLK